MFSFAKTGQQLSEEQQREIALDLLLEAWNNAIDRGVDTEVLAKTAIFAGLSDMVGAYGERAIAEMTEELPRRIRGGDFTVRR
jgi:hypothetical protein